MRGLKQVGAADHSDWQNRIRWRDALLEIERRSQTLQAILDAPVWEPSGERRSRNLGRSHCHLRLTGLNRGTPTDSNVIVITHTDIVITHTGIAKNSLYVQLRVPEFWHYNGQQWRIYQLQGDSYREVDRSPTFAWVDKAALYRFLEQSQQDEAAAEKTFQA